MKIKRLIRILSLLLVISSLTASFCGCLDIDSIMIDMGFYDEKKDVNSKHKVILREGAGYICSDESNQKAVWDGDPVVFHIKLRDGYIYLGNSANADYDEKAGTLKLDHVKAPTTIDVEVGDKYDLYCVDVKVPEDATFEFIRGGEWSTSPGEVTLLIHYDPKMFSFQEWRIHTDGAAVECEASHQSQEQFSFRTTEKGIVKIEAILGPAE